MRKLKGDEMNYIRFPLGKKPMKLAKEVWDGRNEGTHGWMRYYDKWLTFESQEEDGIDFILIALVEKIDSLGYPMTEFLDWTEIRF